MVAGWIRDEKWPDLISFVLAVVILGYLGRAAIIKFFGEQNSQWFFWVVLVVVVLFAVAVVVAVFQKSSLVSTKENPLERPAIKGLLSFGSGDVEIFSRLERNQDIKSCLNLLEDENFRLGILWGESGCGKTSFLQAGLIPELTKRGQMQGIYIQFSDKEPLITVKKALNKTLKLALSNEELEQLDLLSVLRKVIEVTQKPLILFFDQFEQFFVHYQSTEARQPFVKALKDWYDDEEIAVKLLMSFRSDLFYQQYEIQKVLDYSLDSRNNIKLKKFSVEQATKILAMIAETENIEFDRQAIQSFVEQELVDQSKDKSDEPISPVDLQILSLVIGKQGLSENRKFEKAALNKIGRFEGLLYQYLEERLSFREQSVNKTQKEAVIKVLLELIDANGLTRAGAFSVAQLQEKLSTINSQDVRDSLRWLEQERLITPLTQEEETVYQLAHERMIPAVMKLSGKILPKAYKANELLNKQVRFWMESNYNARYLLGWHELWLIKRQQASLLWGDKQSQKQKLIQKSQERLFLFVGVIGLIFLLGVGTWGGLNYTKAGQLWQIRRDLATWTEQVNDPTNQVQAVTAFLKDGELPQALNIANQIKNDDNSKAYALNAIAEAIGKLNQPEEGAKLLKQALNIANQIKDDNSYVLRAIAEAYGKLNQPEEAAKLLKQALDSIQDDRFKAYALSAIAEAYIKLNQPEESAKLLKQAFDSIQDDRFKASPLSEIAEAYIKLNQPEEAAKLLKQALDSIQDDQFKASALSAIAEAIGKLNQPEEAAKLLKQALDSASQINQMKDDSPKASALSAISEAIGKLNQPEEAAKLLKQALDSARQIKEDSPKASALSAIAEAIGKLNQSEEAAKLLKQALHSANQIPDDYKAPVLSGIAEAYGKLNQPEEATKLLSQAFDLAANIGNTDQKTNALVSIAQAHANLKNWGEALTVTKECSTDPCHVESLAAVLTIHAEQQHPELKEDQEN
jgi:tetratricopeptide (TPR) repeat protein